MGSSILDRHLSRAKRANEILLAQAEPGMMPKGMLDAPMGQLPGGIPALTPPSGGAKDLGEPLELQPGASPFEPGGPQSRPQVPAIPMQVGLGYRNMHGTDLNVSVDPVYRNVNANVALPVGDSRRGLTFEARGSYDLQDRIPRGYLGFRKRNLPKNLDEAAEVLGHNDPNTTAYEYGLSLNEPPNRGGYYPGGGMPGALPPQIQLPPDMGVPPVYVQDPRRKGNSAPVPLQPAFNPAATRGAIQQGNGYRY